MRLRLTFALVFLSSLLLPLTLAPAPVAAADCQFVLGFKTVHDLIPDKVGQCKTDEYHNPQNGDGLQETAGGLLVWRKADNWTAFTDGYRTWINGPSGLQQRLNTERFSWEKDPVPPAPTAPATSPNIRWSVHNDAEKSFKYPSGWRFSSRKSGDVLHNYYGSPDGSALIYFTAPFNVGPGFNMDDFISWNTKAWAGQGDFVYLSRQSTSINGLPATLQFYDTTGDRPARAVFCAILKGTSVYPIQGVAETAKWSVYEPILMEVIRSFVAK